MAGVQLQSDNSLSLAEAATKISLLASFCSHSKENVIFEVLIDLE